MNDIDLSQHYMSTSTTSNETTVDANVTSAAEKDNFLLSNDDLDTPTAKKFKKYIILVVLLLLY